MVRMVGVVGMISESITQSVVPIWHGAI